MLLSENFDCFQLFTPHRPVMHAYIVHFNFGGNKVAAAAAASTSCIYYLYDDTILLCVLHNSRKLL